LVHTVSTARVDVFIMETHCLFQDNDGAGFGSLMAFGEASAAEVNESSRPLYFGRSPGVVAMPSHRSVAEGDHASHRRHGFGKILMKEAPRAARGHIP
jgi:hypothetical protein